MRTHIFLLTALILAGPAVAWAQTAETSRSRDVEMVQRLSQLERQNEALRSEVVDLQFQVDHIKRKQNGFQAGSSVATFLISTAVVTTSFWAADQVFGDVSRKYMPELTSNRVVGYGALSALLPSMLAGLGSGLRSSALTSTGITVDVLLAATPWITGAAFDAMATNMPADPREDAPAPDDAEAGDAWF